MGFIRAFTGALGGTFADQWLDFIGPRAGVSATTALFEGVQKGQNAGRGANKRGSANVISNGSRMIVPEGTALITMQDGAITGFIAEPGGYTYTSDEQNSQSFFAGDGIISSTIKTSWERFKFGGIPATQQMVFYINLREIPNNRFGTQSEIYWDDAFFGTQVGAVTRGTYTMRIVDPILFVKQFVPAKYLMPNAPVFDFADMDNDAGAQLFSEVVGSLAGAFSNYTNDPEKGNRISRIQGDSVGFGHSLSQAVENNFQWVSGRGLSIERVVIKAIEYDEGTKALMAQIREADAMGGARANTFMQMSAARGIEAMGSNPNGGAMGMGFMNMGMNAAGGMMQGLQQPVATQPQMGAQPLFDPMTGQPLNQQPQPLFDPMTGQPLNQQPQPMFDPMTGQPLNQQPQPAFDPITGQPIGQGTPVQAEPAVDPVAKLTQMKQLLDAGVITQEEFDSERTRLLGF